MKIRFWLLDINHEVVEGRPEVRLWGLDSHGNRVMVADRGFLPYFYLIPKRAEDAEGLKKLAVDGKYVKGDTSVELEEKLYFGSPVKVVKVTCVLPEDVESYAKRLAKDPRVEMTLLDDLRYTNLYLTDLNLYPSDWLEVEVEKLTLPQKLSVDGAYAAKSSPRMVEEETPPQLRILAFSTLIHAEIGSPNFERDPVLIIATLTSEGKAEVFKAEDHDDRGMLQAFSEYVKSYDPDILVGFGTSHVDLPYLLGRARVQEIAFALDRMGGEPHQSIHGHISVVGRANIDLLDFVTDIPEVKVKTLENAAWFFNVPGKEKLKVIPETEIHRYWENAESRLILEEACRQNVKVVWGLSETLLEYAIQLSRLVGLPLDHVGAAATGFKVDSYLIRQAARFNELIPKRTEQPYYPYKGAIVLAPKPGMHENVAVLDFSAMYPNLMIKYNLSPDTYVKSEGKTKGNVNIAPEVGHAFRKEPPGFYKQVLTNLIQARKSIQSEMEKLDPESTRYRLLEARQRGIKTITNATYGYCGWTGARWYMREVAEATAAWGRHTILAAVEAAKRQGLEVIYGDTDSLFVNYDVAKVERLIKEVEAEVGLTVKPAVIYSRILFTEAKKRYAGLLSDGRIEIVGLEVARGDWCEIAKKVQEKVLEILLRGKRHTEAANFIREYVDNLRRGKVPLQDLVIWKTLTKSVDEYAVRAPHVEAAKRLEERGWRLPPGSKVGYIITKGTGKLYERAKPHILVKPDEVDYDYYVENQILPSVLRILETFKVTKEELIGGEPAAAGRGKKTTLNSSF
ncbi:MAG: DNA polymerase domain-containing protein [Candidatus Bathyarchaeia archaeon]